MRHNLQLRGHRFGLRPVRDDDAAFIHELRSTSERARFLNRGAATLELQQTWLAHYFERAGDYYFVIEDQVNGRAEGLVGIYNLDTDAAAAEWGRWMLRSDSVAAVESALLTYRCAFDELHLELVFCKTLLDNRQVLSFHDRSGLRRMADVEIGVDDVVRRAAEHQLRRHEWPAVAERLDRIAARLAAR